MGPICQFMMLATSVFLTVVVTARTAHNISRGNCEMPLEYSCNDAAQTCRHRRFWCDGKQDCPNGEDELDCKNPTHYFIQMMGDLADQDENGKYINKRPPSGYMRHDCSLKRFPTTCNCSFGGIVNCSDGIFTTVPTDIAPSKLLLTLILEANQIATLPHGVFSNYTSLTGLVISWNRLWRIESGAFQGLISLKTLILDHNELSELDPGTFRNVPRLEILFIANNKLQDWYPDSFKGNHSLKWLNMQHNQIRLQRLNMFEHLGKQSLSVELDDNLITELTNETFKHVRNFLLLGLARNRISAVKEDTFSRIELNEIDLSSNELTNFPRRLFAGQSSLHDLRLSYNPVNAISEDFFVDLQGLQQLSLIGLEIKNISKKMFDSPTLNMQHVYFEKFLYCAYVPRVKDCSPKTDGISTAEHLLDSVYLQIFSWLIGLLAVTVNGFVLGARIYLWKGSSHLSKLHSLCISTLANLIMGIYMLIISIVDGIYRAEYYVNSQNWVHSSLCRFAGFISVVSCEVSTLLLVFMAIERYNRLIWIPMSRSNCADLRYTIGWLIVCWLIGITVALVPLVAQLDTDGVQVFYGQNGLCLPLFIHDPYLKGWEISAVIFIVTPIAAMFIISFCYASIFLHVQQSRQASDRNKADKSHLKKVLAITISNNVSWVAIIITKILALCMVAIPGGTYAWMAVFALPVNCCLNPIIYTLMTPEFRSMVRTCSQRRSNRFSAEASALRHIVSYTTGANSLSRGSVRTLQRSIGSSGSSVAGSARCILSQQNSLVTFTRQGSIPAVSSNNRHQRSSRRRSTSANLLGHITVPLVREEANAEEDEDEGIVVVANSDPPATPPKWDC